AHRPGRRRAVWGGGGGGQARVGGGHAGVPRRPRWSAPRRSQQCALCCDDRPASPTSRGPSPLPAPPVVPPPASDRPLRCRTGRPLPARPAPAPGRRTRGATRAEATDHACTLRRHLAGRVNAAGWEKATVAVEGAENGLGVRAYLDRKAWLPLWQEVIVLLAG